MTASAWTQLPETWPQSPSAAIAVLDAWLQAAALHLRSLQGRLVSERQLPPNLLNSEQLREPQHPQAGPPNLVWDLSRSPITPLTPGLVTAGLSDVAALQISLDRIPAVLAAARERLVAWEASLADRGAPVGLYAASGDRPSGVDHGQVWGEG